MCSYYWPAFFARKRRSFTKEEKAIYVKSEKTLLVRVDNASTDSDRLLELFKHIVDWAEFDPAFVYNFDEEKNYYIQAAASSEGIVCEVVSNEFLSETNVLNSEKIKQLRELGWQDDNLNYDKRFEIDTDLNRIVENSLKTINVYGASKDSKTNVDIII